jgi:methionine synthase II (cobalamin-independent)
MKASLPLLPTSVVGSHAKMGWWYLVRQEAESGRMGARDLAEALDTAVDIAILDQERAGVDVISAALGRSLPKLKAMVEGTKIVWRELGQGD